MSSKAELNSVELSTASRRQPRRRWLVALIITAPLAAIGCVYAIACWRGFAALERESEKIRERGEPLRFIDLAPASDDPALARGARISALLDKVALGAWTFTEAANEDLSPEQRAELAQLVDKNLPICREIVAIAGEGECRFAYNFAATVPHETLLPHIDKLSNVALIFFIATLDSLTASDSSVALHDIERLLRTAEILRAEPFYVSQLVRARLAGHGLDLLQSLLGQADVESERLSHLDRQIAIMEENYRLQKTVFGERSSAMTMLENLGRPEMGEFLASVESLGNYSSIVSHAAWKNRWWGSWVYRPRRWYAQSVILRTESRVAESIDAPGAHATAEIDRASREFHSRDDIPASGIFVTNPVSVRQTGLAHRQRLISARIALSVARQRITDGALPDSLDEVEDQPIENATGLLSGKPLVYEKTAAGFAIYDELPEQGRFEVKFALPPRNRSQP